MHIFYTIVKYPFLINLLIRFSRTQPSWPLKVFCKGDEKGLLFDKIKSIVLTLACHFEINVISLGYRILYLPLFCPAVLLWEGLRCLIPVSDVAPHPLWVFYLQEPGPKLSEKKQESLERIHCFFEVRSGCRYQLNCKLFCYWNCFLC